MKKIILILLCVSLQVLNAQNTRRYYPSLDLIFMNPDEEKTLPNSFKFLSDWSKETADNIFYSNLQRNGNPKNSASFNSLDLILKRKFDFDFLDTGFILSFNKNKLG